MIVMMIVILSGVTVPRQSTPQLFAGSCEQFCSSHLHLRLAFGNKNYGQISLLSVWGQIWTRSKKT